MSGDYNQKFQNTWAKVTSDNNALSTDYIERVGLLSTALSGEIDDAYRDLTQYTDTVSSEFKTNIMTPAIDLASLNLSTHIETRLSQVLTLSGVLSFKGYKTDINQLNAMSDSSKTKGDIWLVGNSDKETDEYIWDGNNWKLIGNIKISDLNSEYAKISYVDGIDEEIKLKLYKDNDILSTDYNKQFADTLSKINDDNTALSTDYIERVGLLSTALSGEIDDAYRDLTQYTDTVSSKFKNDLIPNEITFAKNELKSHIESRLENVLSLSGLLSLKGAFDRYEDLSEAKFDKNKGDIYLVGNKDTDRTDEYVWDGSNWKLIGNIKFNSLITDYALSADVTNITNNIIVKINRENDVLSTDYNNKINVLSGGIDYISGRFDNVTTQIDNKIDNGFSRIETTYDEKIAASSGALSADYDSKIGSISGILQTEYYTETQVDTILTGYVAKYELNNIHTDIAHCKLDDSNVTLPAESIDLSSLIDCTYTPEGKLNTTIPQTSRTPNLIRYSDPANTVLNGTSGVIAIPHFNSEISQEIEFWETLKVNGSSVKVDKIRNYISKNVDDILCIHNDGLITHNHRFYDYNNTTNYENYFTNNYYVTFMFKIKILNIGGTCKNLISLVDWFETKNILEF